MGIFDAGRQMMQQVRADHTGEPVTIVVGGVEIPDVMATPLSSQMGQVAESQGGHQPVILVTDMQAWNFTSSDYVNGDGDAVQPAPGDRIIDADGDEFEVLPPDKPGAECFQLFAGGTQMTVFTKRINAG